MPLRTDWTRHRKMPHWDVANGLSMEFIAPELHVDVEDWKVDGLVPQWNPNQEDDGYIIFSIQPAPGVLVDLRLEWLEVVRHGESVESIREYVETEIAIKQVTNAATR